MNESSGLFVYQFNNTPPEVLYSPQSRANINNTIVREKWFFHDFTVHTLDFCYRFAFSDSYFGFEFGLYGTRY